MDVYRQEKRMRRYEGGDGSGTQSGDTTRLSCYCEETSTTPHRTMASAPPPTAAWRLGGAAPPLAGSGRRTYPGF